MYQHFSFKGPSTSLISSVSHFHLEIRSFLWGLSGDWTEFWAPVTAWVPPIGGYGVRLIRLCLAQYCHRVNTVLCACYGVLLVVCKHPDSKQLWNKCSLYKN